MADFTIKQGDDFTITGVLEDASGDPVSINGATVTFTMVATATGTPTIDAEDASNDQVGSGTDGSKGHVSYEGDDGDSDTVGTHLAWWTVEFADSSVRTFPDGDPLLVEVTATDLIGRMAFATSTDLANRLGIEFTAAEHMRAAALLAGASDLIRDEVGQTISLVEDDEVELAGAYGSRIRLPQRPIVEVTSVALDGTALEDSQWYVEGDELVRSGVLPLSERRFGILGAWGAPSLPLVVTYTHGYATIPSIVKAVCLEVVVRVWVNPGAVFRESIGNTQVMYDSNISSPTGSLMKDSEREAVNAIYRRTAGSQVLR